MILLCRGLQTITAHHQTDGTVTTEKVTELVTALSASLERKYHKMEYNAVLAETTLSDPRLKKLGFNNHRAFDEALQRLITATARCNPSSHPDEPAQPPGGQEGEEGARAVEVEPQTSAVWRLC